MKRYDSYKDSGVEWIGEIPSHWIKGKWGYYYNSGMGSTILKEDLVEDGEVPVYSATQEDRVFGYINNPKLILNEGDIVIPARGNSIGHVKLISNKSTTSQTTIYSKSKDENLDSRYSYYYCKGNKTNLFPFVQTAIPQITVTEISFNPIIIPPLSEQQQIVSFLDTKTSLIDSLIEKTQRKIELLKEKRTSLINEVVTKGLNPNVEMKDSGVEWIGEIPSHWEKCKIKHLSKTISKGTTPSTIGREIIDEGTIYYIKIDDFDDYSVHTPNKFIDETTQKLLERSSLQENDILVVITGSTTGKTVILPKECIPSNTNQNISFVRLKESKKVKFTWYWLFSKKIQSQVSQMFNVSTLPSLSMEDLGNFQIPQPPISEQQQIVEYLDTQTGLVDKTISIEEKRIELLKEYRQSLISEVVTGKRKVV